MNFSLYANRMFITFSFNNIKDMVLAPSNKGG